MIIQFTNMIGYNELEKKLREISDMWHPSHRKGDTGIGRSMGLFLEVRTKN